MTSNQHSAERVHELMEQHLDLQKKYVGALKEIVELHEQCSRFRAAVEHMDCLCHAVAVPPCAKCYALRETQERSPK